MCDDKRLDNMQGEPFVKIAKLKLIFKFASKLLLEQSEITLFLMLIKTKV